MSTYSDYAGGVDGPNVTGNPLQRSGSMQLLRPQGVKPWAVQPKSDVSWMHQGNRGQLMNGMDQRWGMGAVGGGGVPYGPIWSEGDITRHVGALQSANDVSSMHQQNQLRDQMATSQGFGQNSLAMQAAQAGMQANRTNQDMGLDEATRWGAAEGNANHMLQGATANATDLTNRARINADLQNQRNQMMMRWGGYS